MILKSKLLNKILIVLIICFSFLMKSNSLKAQQNAVRNKSDSIALYKGSVIVIGNKSITAYKDTIVVLPKNIQYEIKNDPSVETNLFYDSLKTKSARNPITKELYDLLITHDRKDTLFNKDKTSLSEDEYKPYNGRKIRNITIKRLEAFGTSVVDTSMQSESWLAKAANDIHIVTFEKVIKGNLLIKKGEKLNSYLLAENERIQQVEKKARTLIDQNKNFALKSFFETFYKEQGLSPENGWRDQIDESNPSYNETSLAVTFKGQTTESVVKILTALEKNPMIYVKDLTLKHEGSKKISLEISLATKNLKQNME